MIPARRWNWGGYALLTLAMIAYGARKAPLSTDKKAAMPVLAAALGLAGVRCVRRRRQLAVVSANEKLSQDRRAPVVYLRAFQDDAVAGERTSGFRSWITFGMFSYWSTGSEEEQMAAVMNDFGPFVALANPRAAEVELGASRKHAADEEWQREIRHWLAVARLVVVRAAYSPNLQWELDEIGRTVDPQRLLVLVPQSADEYERFRKCFPFPLPSYDGASLVYGSLRGLVYVDQTHTPRFVPLKAAFFRASVFHPFTDTLRLAMEPVFQAMAVPYRRPPVTWYSVATVVLFAGMMVALGQALVR